MGTAAAEVVVHALDNLVSAERRILEHHCIGVHKHAGCAESALNSAMFEESLLQRVQFVSLRQSFDRHDVFPFYVPDRQTAGANGLFINDDSAGAAKSHAASEFGSRESEIRTQNPEERPVAFNFYAGWLPVKIEFDGFFHIDSRD